MRHPPFLFPACNVFISQVSLTVQTWRILANQTRRTFLPLLNLERKMQISPYFEDMKVYLYRASINCGSIKPLIKFIINRTYVTRSSECLNYL